MSVLWRKCWFRVVFVLAQKRTWIIQLSSIIYPFCQMPSCSWMSLNEAAISTVLIGSCIWLVGRLKLARLVKACPFVIYGGFMAGTGAVGAWEKGQKAKRQRQKTTKQLSNFSETISAFSAFSIQLSFDPLNLSGSAAIRLESDGPRLHQPLRQNLHQTKWKFPAFVLDEVNWWMTFFWMFPKTFLTSKRKEQNNETFCWQWFF